MKSVVGFMCLRESLLTPHHPRWWRASYRNDIVGKDYTGRKHSQDIKGKLRSRDDWIKGLYNDTNEFVIAVVIHVK